MKCDNLNEDIILVQLSIIAKSWSDESPNALPKHQTFNNTSIQRSTKNISQFTINCKEERQIPLTYISPWQRIVQVKKKMINLGKLGRDLPQRDHKCAIENN